MSVGGFQRSKCKSRNPQMSSPESFLRVLFVFTKQCGLLVCIMGIAVAPTSVYAYRDSGTLGLTVVSLAAGACFVGGVASLFLAALIRYAKQDRGIEFLAASAARMGIVLTIAFTFFVGDGDLGDAGIVHYLVFFYVTMLWADVWLLIREGKETPPTPAGSAMDPAGTATDEDKTETTTT